ncbi:lysophospholipid acyltransferase family protein [Pseudohoeflea coraliihabitans]|uniref:1-acyl-sn-glycerol-3-phosphate acyltransferase n=1 Tax=Pseudohoeflea coraliihabitans TaxID=2860393 RepID=A0ABS6WNW5_9HYPH|nr:lysophospholipid acyltransferase family protein [Pseudohoeflea sp. DP4N28-3]MBW3097656.1 1-acyl-sn-glycerol-3-phosphate acyltransferase [Pseudohoeflea sp. DP4N28-3]
MTALRLIGVGLVFLVLTLLLLPLQLLAIATGHEIRRRLPRHWHRVMARTIGFRIAVRGAPADRRPLLLISNHVSWKDIIILGAITDVVFVAKSEVRTWPVFGWLARLQRSVFIDRQRRRTTGVQIGEMAARLTAGEILVLFPEGTTSDGNRTLPFKTALFGAATAALQAVPDRRVHVQPVSIAYLGLHGLPMGRYHRPVAAWPGDIPLAPHLLRVLQYGALDIEVCFGEPLAFDETTDRKRAARRLEAQITEMLAGSLQQGPHPRQPAGEAANADCHDAP